MDPSKSVKYFDSALCISAHLQKEPWHTSMVMSPEELSFLNALKRGGAKQGMEGGCDWSASGDRIDRAAVARMFGRHQMNVIN